MQYTDDGLESIVGLDLRRIEEAWVGDDCLYQDLGTKFIGQPEILSTHDVPCCLAGIAEDGEIFTAPLAAITVVIASFSERRSAHCFPEGLMAGRSGSFPIDDDD